MLRKTLIASFRGKAYSHCVGVRCHRRAHRREAQGRHVEGEGSPTSGASTSRREQPSDHRERAHAKRAQSAIRRDQKITSTTLISGSWSRPCSNSSQRRVVADVHAAAILHRAVREHRRVDDPRPQSAVSGCQRRQKRDQRGCLGQPGPDRHRARHQRSQACISGGSQRQDQSGLSIYTAPTGTLSVTDSGIGMPADTTAAKPGLGTSIVQALTAQLQAQVKISDANPGTIVSIAHTQIAALAVVHAV